LEAKPTPHDLFVRIHNYGSFYLKGCFFVIPTVGFSGEALKRH